MVRKYGKDDVESIHHWVTQEVRSARGDHSTEGGSSSP